MSYISSWILSIVGVSILGVLVDLMLPEGQVSKYIKGIFGIFLIFVIITPIAKLTNISIDITDTFNYQDTQINQELLDYINESQADNLEKTIVSKLEDAGFSNLFVDICYNQTSTVFLVEKIVVDMENLVINANLPHINKYTEIKDTILSIISIEEENIVLNE